jgi:tetratricopeptide (TPR) repeat protein
MMILVLFLLLQSSPDALSEAATRLASEKHYDEAVALWTKALAAAPDHFPSLFNLGYTHFTLGRFDEAAPFLARAARVRPADFNVHYVLGSALVSSGRREQGLAEWKRALAVQPNNRKLMQLMAIEYANGQYFREACETARRAIGDDLNGHLIAIKACQDARDPSTIELARQAVTRFPDSARTNFEYGFELQRVGKREQSVPYLRKAMEADPAYEEPFFFYGDLLVRDEQYAQAVDYLRTALRNRPDYVAACVSLARALMGLERYREAAEELERCAHRSPKHPQPHLLLSQLYFISGDEERARVEKQLSLRLRRENPTLMEAPQARAFPPVVR